LQAGETAGSTAVALDDATVAFRLAGDRVYTRSKRPRSGSSMASSSPSSGHRCGKSTLLNVAAAAQAGHRDGTNLRCFAFRPQPAGRYLFQADALFSLEDAIDNVAIGLEDIRRAARLALERAQGWLSAVGLGGLAIAIRICCRAGSASALALRRC